MKVQYKQFNTSVEANTWANHFKSYFPSDNDDDKKFLTAIDFYSASANPIFNNHLRYNKPLETDDFLYPYVQKMKAKLPNYYIPDNIIVYRYICKGLLKAMCSSYPPKRGMLLHDKGFMSTTLIRESVNDYRSVCHQNILLVISVPSGTKGTYIGLLKNSLKEYEVILAPNTKLRIDNKIPLFNNYFECTVVD